MRVSVNQKPHSSSLMRKLSRAKQRAHKKGNPSWRFLSKLLSTQLRKALSNLASTTINSSIKGTKKWWTNIKLMAGECPEKNKAPFIHIEDSWLSITSFTEKLNEYYLEPHQNADLKIPVIPAAEETTTPPIDEEQVYNLLTHINTHKSTNSADYPSWISKNNAHLISKPVTHIINTIISQRIYPAYWKQAEITPLNKVKNPKLFKDMRPISLLFHLGKIAEKILVTIIHTELPLLPSQYAYTTHLSTTDALVKLTTDVVNQLDNKDTIAVQALMLDFSKAFDRMRPGIMINRLIDLNINPRLINIILSILSERTQCIKYHGFTSAYRPSYIGVPQGTIMGPVLWNIFVNTLKPDLAHVKYADDTTVYHSIQSQDVHIDHSTPTEAAVTFKDDNPLQRAANYSTTWSSENNMLLNPAKSTLVTFSLRKTIHTEPLTINDTKIAEHEKVKLLGVTFDRHLRFSAHVETAITKSKPAFHALVQLKKSGIAPPSLALFYHSRIVSILTYAAPCWYPHTSNHDREKLEKYQRLCLRIILPNETSYENRLAKLQLPTMSALLEDVCVEYIQKLRSPEHYLHHLMPTRTYNQRTGKPYTIKARSAMLRKSLFHTYA